MLISIVEFYNHPQGAPLLSGQMITTFFALFIGSISFTGSFIAYGKLQGFLRDSLVLPAPKVINMVLLLVIVGLSVYTITRPELDLNFVLIILVLSLVYGVTFVTPIGGGDMPVVISLLNSFTGLGAALAGLIYGNQVMLVGGILVGASGTILTILMCQAMNRSLLNVIVGGFTASGGGAGVQGDQVAKEATYADTAIMLKYAQKVMIVPGYGMAVAQAQHTVHDLEKALEQEGVAFKYAIHPVAGRMPGHMNVLLAEAEIPYEKLKEMEVINPTFGEVDMAIVIGANDVVNPVARDDPDSPIAGMPILDVDRATHVFVVKRSMNPGFAGVHNPLFFNDNTMMIFGDAKSTIEALVSEFKST